MNDITFAENSITIFQVQVVRFINLISNFFIYENKKTHMITFDGEHSIPYLSLKQPKFAIIFIFRIFGYIKSCFE